MRNGQNVVVFAPRRYGKSSLVWRAAQELIETDTQRVVTGAATAAESGGRELTVPAAVLAVGGLVLLGLYRRIDEYRYHA